MILEGKDSRYIRTYVSEGKKIDMDHPEFFTVNAVCVCANVIFFIIVQCLIFWFVSSRELERVMLHTTDTLVDLRRNLRSTEGQDATVSLLDGLVVGMGHGSNSKTPDKLKEEQDHLKHENLMLLVRYAGSYLLFVVILLVCLLIYNRIKKRPFGQAHWFGLALVVMAYVAEILLLFLVIMPWRHTAKFDIVAKILGARCDAVQA